MEFRILGPLEVVDDGRRLALGGSRQRALLAVLLLHANEVVSTDRLLEELWGENPPETGPKALQVAVSQLRKTLQSTAGAGGRLVTRPPGYLLSVEEGELDGDRFAGLVAEAAEQPDARVRAGKLREALALWRGSALADLAYEDFAQPAIARLEEARLAALEERIDADLDAGRDAALVGELEELVAGHPLRERLRAQLMLALYRSGRQADALGVYQDARRTLVEELGVEPGPDLQALQKAVLGQDTALGGVRKPRRPSLPPERRPPRRRRLLVALGLSTAALAAAVAGLALARGEGSGTVVVQPNAVAVIDPGSNEIVDAIPVDANPGPIAATPGVVWVLNLGSSTLSRIDSRARALTLTAGIGGTPGNLATSGRELWVVDRCSIGGDPGDVLRIATQNPEQTEVFDGVSLTTPDPGEARPTPLPSAPACGLGASGQSAWAASNVPAGLVRVDIDPGSQVAVVADATPLVRAPAAVAVGTDVVWASDSAGNVVRQIEPETGLVVRAVRVGRAPVALAVAGDAVWVANRDDGSVSRIDQRTNSVRKVISVGEEPVGLAVGGSSVWVANSGDGTVSRIDPTTNTVVQTIQVGHRPQGIVYSDGVVWVTVRE